MINEAIVPYTSLSSTTSIEFILWLLQLLLVTGVNRSLGISDEWFAMGDSLILTVLGQVCLGSLPLLTDKCYRLFTSELTLSFIMI
jgi:hypothetical protein